MANKDAAFGLRPIGKVGQNDANQGLSEYSVSASSAAIYFQDPVRAASQGTIRVAAAGETLIGTLNGIFFTDANTSKPTFANNLKASNTATDIVAFVADDPDQMFVVQQDSVASSLSGANINENANLIFGSGSTTTGLSGVEIDSSSATTTATLQVRIVAGYETPSNTISTAAAGNNSVFVVKINNHQLGSSTGTAGV